MAGPGVKKNPDGTWQIYALTEEDILELYAAIRGHSAALENTVVELNAEMTRAKVNGIARSVVLGNRIASAVKDDGSRAAKQWLDRWPR